jgi:hypothetical protein
MQERARGGARHDAEARRRVQHPGAHGGRQVRPFSPLSFLNQLLIAVVDHGLNCMLPVGACAVSLIDDGKNPDEFTRDVLNSCIAKNQITKGKTDAFKVCMPQLAVKTFVAKFTFGPKHTHRYDRHNLFHWIKTSEKASWYISFFIYENSN